MSLNCQDKKAVLIMGCLPVSAHTVYGLLLTEKRSVFYSLQCPLLVELCIELTEIKV